MEKLQIHELTNIGEALLNDARLVVASVSDRAKDVPAHIIDENECINVVFVGQYGAGKSTIISLLTGEKLEIGAGVTTASCSSFSWDGIKIWDTPGIHTQNRPDHDAVTYDALSKADLIVFVITHNGFGGCMGEHFRKLAVENNKAAEIMLVVNKMDSTAKGNTKEQQDIVFDGNIKPIISPFTREELYTTFISSIYWERGLKETDDEKKKRLFEKSGCNNFIENLNLFISDKHLLGKHTTNLFKLEQLLTEIIAGYHTNDECSNGVREIMTRQRRALLDAKTNVITHSRRLIRNETGNIIKWGDELASQISSSLNKDAFEGEVRKYAEKTNDVYGNALKQLESLIEEENMELENKFDSISSSQFGQQVISNIKKRIAQNSISPEFMRKLGKWGKYFQEGGTSMANFAKGTNATGTWQNFFKVSEASGSKAHDVVLTVGHFFGHKFVPWEATKWAANIGKAGKILGVVGAVLGIVGQLVADEQERKQEKQIAEARSEIRRGFNEAADIVDLEFDKNTQKWVEANYGKAIKEIDEHLDDMEKEIAQKDKEYNALIELRDRTRQLIMNIQVSMS